jgi:hypothetical protein
MKKTEGQKSRDTVPLKRTFSKTISWVDKYFKYFTLLGDVVAQLGMWWLSGGCGGSVGDVVAQLGMWWLS